MDNEPRIEITKEEGPPPLLEAPLPPGRFQIGRPGIAMEFEHTRGGRLSPQGLEGHPAVIRARNQEKK